MLGAIARLVVTPHHVSPFLGAAARQATFLRSVNYGVCLGTMVFGLNLVAFAKTLRVIWRDASDRRARDQRSWSSKRWLLFVVILWTTSLANEICHVIMNSNARIDYDMSQHSSFDYFTSHQTSTVNMVSVASQAAGIVLTDMFLLLRCHCLWKTTWVTLPLFLLTLINFVCIYKALVRGVLQPGLEGVEGLWMMPFFTNWPIRVGFTGILHTLYTLLLALRSRWRRRERAFVVLAIDSAFVHGAVSVAFASLYCAGFLAANVLLPSLTQVQAIAVELIIARLLDHEGHMYFPEAPACAPGDPGLAGTAATAWTRNSAARWDESFHKLEDIYEDDESALFG